MISHPISTIESVFKVFPQQSLRLPNPRPVTRWMVGITTAPRRNPTLKQCVASVKQAGWEPIIFAEPGSDLTGAAGCQIVERSTRLGAWHNWREMSIQLLADDPAADAILTIQDDTILAPGCREFLERDLWPCPDVGFVSLYTPKHYSILHVIEDEAGNEISRHLNEQRAHRKARATNRPLVQRPRPVGCWRVSTSSLWGACALIFPRDALARIVEHRIARAWKGVRRTGHSKPRLAHEIANVDTAIGKIVHALRLEMRTYTPSLAQHVARYSSIGHGDNRGRRAAVDYVGNNANLWSVFAATADRIRYYSDGTPHCTGQADYDAACRSWQELGQSTSMSISVECWNELKQFIADCPGRPCRTLEFGSGLSTRLFKDMGTDHGGVDHSPVDQGMLDHRAIEEDANIAALLGPPVEHHPLVGNGWYNFIPAGKPYDLILIDGPQGTGQRNQVLQHLGQLVHGQTVIVVDDTLRASERQLAEQIANQLDYVLHDRNRYVVLTPPA